MVREFYRNSCFVHNVHKFVEEIRPIIPICIPRIERIVYLKEIWIILKISKANENDKIKFLETSNGRNLPSMINYTN